MKRIRNGRRLLRGSVAAIAVGCATFAGHLLVFADQGLSSSIDVFIDKPVMTNETLGLSIFSEGGAVPPSIPVGVGSNVQLSLVGEEFPDVSSVQTVLGGDLSLPEGTISGARQTVNASFVSGSLPDSDYLAVVDARLLSFEAPVATRGSVLAPVLSASDFIRTVVDASGTTPARGVSTTNRELAEIGIDVDVFDLADIDDDRNAIPNATDLLNNPELLIASSNRNITAIVPLDGILRGAPLGATFSQSLNTSSGPIDVEVTAPLLADLQAADAGFNAFDAGRLILTISQNAASTLDGPDGVDPIGEFDTLIGPAPQNVFVRTSIAVTDSTAIGTPVWTFVNQLPGTLRITVELSGPGIEDLLTDGQEVGFYTYLVTGSQSGENIFFDGDEAGWEETLSLVLSDQTPVVRTATASIGDDTITARSDTGTAIWGTSAVSSMVVSGGSGSSGGCFIATAAYGTPLNAEIDALRAVRDRYMLSNPVGSLFANTYYRLSPPIAEEVSASSPLQALVRALVTPMVALSKLLLASPVAVTFGALGVTAGAIATMRRRRLRD